MRAAIVYTWDHKSSQSFWAGMKVWVYKNSTLLSPHKRTPPNSHRANYLLMANFRQPILADEVQTFKALITVHKVLQEGHPIAIREAQDHTNWLESLIRGVSGDGLRGTSYARIFTGDVT